MFFPFNLLFQRKHEYQRREQAKRNINKENPTPGEVIHDQTTKRWPNNAG
jgi:hypothetical protein